MGINRFILVLLWYLVPFISLCLFEGVWLSNVFLILLFFCAGLTVGFFSFTRVRLDYHFSYELILTRVLCATLWFTALVQLYGAYRLAVDGFDLSTYRDDFFEAKGGIFKSTYLFTLYSVFLIPLVTLSAMYFLNKKTITTSRRYVQLAYFLIAADGILHLGRFQYLTILLLVYLSYKQRGIKKRSLLIGFALIILFSFVTIYVRQFFMDASMESGLEVFNWDVLKKSIINYQYVGYFLLDHYTEGVSFWGNPLEANTLSFFFLFAKIFVTKFGLDLTYNWESYSILLTEGIHVKALNGDYNAFSTNFLPLYLDLGIPGILCFGFFAGAVMAIKTENILLKAIQFLNIYILMFGIYQPLVTKLTGFVLLVAYFIFFIFLIKQIQKTCQANKIREA